MGAGRRRRRSAHEGPDGAPRIRRGNAERRPNLRLPGTVNIPSRAKLKAGRVACPTRLIQFNGATCSLEDFPAATAKRGAPDNANSASFVDTDEFENIEPDDPRLTGLSAKWIALGHDATGIAENYGGDRSRAVMAFTAECFRAGIAEEIVASLLMRWKIGEHIRDQSDVTRALNRTIDKAKQFCPELEAIRDEREARCPAHRWQDEGRHMGRRPGISRPSDDHPVRNVLRLQGAARQVPAHHSGRGRGQGSASRLVVDRSAASSSVRQWHAVHAGKRRRRRQRHTEPVAGICGGSPQA